VSRIRTVKPEWMEDEQLLRSGSDARVLSICLILLADDYGRGRFIPEVMASQCFPFTRESSRVFSEALAILSDVGFVTVYEVRSQRYFEIPNWDRHQKVDKPGKPRVPAPLDDSRESSRDILESLAPDHDHDHDHDQTLCLLPVDPTKRVSNTNADDVRKVYDRWVSVWGMNPQSTKLDGKRTECIKRALKNYPLEDVLDAIEGAHLDPFLLGQNDRQKVYSSITLHLRDSERIEANRDLKRRGNTPLPVAAPYHQRLIGDA
jgi:hypothetical protein